MPRTRDRRVALVGARGSLVDLGRRLARRGWQPVRVAAVRTEPVRVRFRPRWLGRQPPADLWIVTSRAVVTTFLRHHATWVRRLRRVPWVAAVGPETALALRRTGIRNVGLVARGGSDDLLARLGPIAGVRVLYLRSDRAGPALARRLRAGGARVVDRVVYRTRPGPRLARGRRERIGSIPVWVVTSPSALAGLRYMLGRPTFDRYRGEVRAFAFGERTARSLRTSGVRQVRTPNESTEEGFTRLLEKALGDAPHGRRRRGP